MSVVLLLVLVLLAALNLCLWRQVERRLNTMGAALDQLKADIAAEDDLLAQAIVTLNSIPGLIAAAQGAANPDSALTELSADIETHTASLKAAIAAAPAPPAAPIPPVTTLTLSPQTVSFSSGSPSTSPLVVSGGVPPYVVTGLPAGVSYDGGAGMLAEDGTTPVGAYDFTVADSSVTPLTGAGVVTIV